MLINRSIVMVARIKVLKKNSAKQVFDGDDVADPKIEITKNSCA
jgi:hypothetical protein